MYYLYLKYVKDSCIIPYIVRLAVFHILRAYFRNEGDV